MFSTKRNKRRVRTLSGYSRLQQVNGARTPTPGPPARLRFSEPLKSTKFKRPMRVLPVKRLFPSRSLTCTLRVKMEWDLKRKERGRDGETKTKRWKDGKTERRKWEKKKRPNSRKQNPCQNMSETEKHKPTTTNHHLPRRLPVAHGFCSDSFGGGMFQHIKNFFGGSDFSFG